MAGTLATTSGGVVAAPSAGSGTVATPTGTGAAGAANRSMVRMAILHDQALRGLQILEDVSREVLTEATVTGDMAEHLHASLGERMSLQDLRLLAGMLAKVVDGTRQVVVRSNDSLRAALLANYEVLVAQKRVHDLGADGSWIDSQRRAG